MINVILAPVYRTIAIIQRTLTLFIAYWPIVLIALALGLSFEEIIYGFRILKWFALI
jgi:hypothetical protein